jgi:hypothetical protein
MLLAYHIPTVAIAGVTVVGSYSREASSVSNTSFRIESILEWHFQL